jgi:hypothetical protein
MTAKSNALLSSVQILMLAVMPVVLTGCSRDSRQADIKQCIVRSERSQNHDFQPTDSADERHDEIGDLIAACMSDAGYGHANGDETDARCIDDVDFNPYCYRKR